MLLLSFSAVFPFFSSPQPHLSKSFRQGRRPHYFTMHSTPQAVLRGTILVTNDDGISPRTGLALSLAQALASAGHDVTVLAPSSNRSACGHGITLFRSLALRRHPSLEAAYSVSASNGSKSSGEIRAFSLDGTPADCVAAAIEPETGVLARLGLQARAVVSGVNLGPNLGADVLYSGTVAAARQAAMYGVPGVAASLGDASNLSAHGEAFAERAAAGALRAVVRIVTGVLQAAESPAVSGNGVTGIRERCAQGDIFVNVNVPGKWNGRYKATRLDDVKYFDVVRMQKLPENEDEETMLTFSGGRREAGEAHDSDGWAVKEGFCAVSTLQTWPWSHPRFVPNAEIESATNMGIDGLPLWLAQVGDVHEKEHIATQMPTYREVEGVANEHA